jgi:Flp pilus assembly protein TadD
MSMRLAEMMETSQAVKDLSRQAIAPPRNGEWERAVEVNRAILSRRPAESDAMGQLGKALMESARYGEARGTLGTGV